MSRSFLRKMHSNAFWWQHMTLLVQNKLVATSVTELEVSRCNRCALIVTQWQSWQTFRHCKIIRVYLTRHKLQMWSSFSSETSCWRADEASQVSAEYQRSFQKQPQIPPLLLSTSLTVPAPTTLFHLVCVVSESTWCVYTSQPSFFVSPLPD